MKLIAKQIPPEYQTSPLDYGDEIFDGIVSDGNRDYISRTTREYDLITKYLDNACYDWENRTYYGDTLTEILRQYGFEKNSGKRWSPRELHDWKLIFEGKYDEEETILHALDLITGGKWECKTIRGYCQGDWQDIYFDSREYGDEAIKLFEIDYFNMGDEWNVYPENDEDDKTGIYTYENPRTEIASAFGVKEEEIELYVFDGYERTAKYKLAA